LIQFKNLLIERKFSDDLEELIKNLDIISVLGKGVNKISTNIASQPYESFGDIEVKKIEKLKEILTGFEKTIKETNAILSKEGIDDKEENSGREGSEETNGRGNPKFTNPGQELPTNI